MRLRHITLAAISFLTALAVPVVADPSKTWQFSENKDRFTDKAEFSIMKMTASYDGAMGFGCEEGEALGVLIFWGKNIATSAIEETTVELRQGSEPMTSGEWTVVEGVDTDGSALEIGGREILDRFLPNLESSPIVIARTRGDIGSAFLEIDLTGLREAAKQLDTHCR